MDNRRLSKKKQAYVLAALCEGTPIRAIARMFKTEKYVITRIIRETGEAFADYMDSEFRDLRCLRIEMDEQWQYVGCHSGRMPKVTTVYGKRDKTRGRLLAVGVHRRGYKAGSLAQRSGSAITRQGARSLKMCASASKGRCRSQPTIFLLILH